LKRKTVSDILGPGMAFFTRTDIARNIRRYYLVTVTRTLFGEWALVREWGRIGLSGTLQQRSFESERDARKEEGRSIRRRLKRGYIERVS
jgi:predicted DNA-binding WGR domain protein